MPRFQFSLRTVFVVMAVAAVLFAGAAQFGSGVLVAAGTFVIIVAIALVVVTIG